jgi:hemolysin III
MDHANIFLLIAGSYAPFALLTLASCGGIRLFAVVAALGIGGAVAELFLRERQPGWLSTCFYLAMGWAVIFQVADVYALLPAPAFWLLLAGGLCYSVGVVFFALKRIRYMHSVFHVFVLAGSVCITLAALVYVV